MKRELEPIDVNLNNAGSFVHELTVSLINNPDAMQYVYLWGLKGTLIGKFLASFPERDGKFYLQLEDFEPPEIAERFLTNPDSLWEIEPGGIYRSKYFLHQDTSVSQS